MSSKPPASPRNAKEALEQFRRDCWIPQVKKGEGEVASSRFGGRPALRPRESWPKCGLCRKQMPLFVQIDLAAAPRPASTPDSLQSGLLQLFYCNNENCDPVDCGAFPKNAVARILPSRGLSTLSAASGGPELPAKRVTKWVALADFPNYSEAISLGIKASEDALDEYYAKESDRGNAIPLRYDKLFGWPYWVQGMFYPKCPTCKKKMIYLFQMASEDHIPFMFGDSGVGHVCVCPDHPERASFYWSCC